MRTLQYSIEHLNGIKEVSTQMGQVAPCEHPFAIVLENSGNYIWVEQSTIKFQTHNF